MGLAGCMDSRLIPKSAPVLESISGLNRTEIERNVCDRLI